MPHNGRPIYQVQIMTVNNLIKAAKKKDRKNAHTMLLPLCIIKLYILIMVLLDCINYF